MNGLILKPASRGLRLYSIWMVFYFHPINMDQSLHWRLGTSIWSTRLKGLDHVMSSSHRSSVHIYLTLSLTMNSVSIEQSRLNSIHLKDDTGTGVLAWLLCLSYLLGPTTYHSRGVLPNTLLRIECFAILAYVGITPVTWEIQDFRTAWYLLVRRRLISSSFEATPEFHLPTHPSESRTPLPVCSTSIMVWRHCHSMRQICFCIYSCKYWEGFLFEMGGAAIFEIPNVEAWIHSLPAPLAWGTWGMPLNLQTEFKRKC